MPPVGDQVAGRDPLQPADDQRQHRSTPAGGEPDARLVGEHADHDRHGDHDQSR